MLLENAYCSNIFKCLDLKKMKFDVFQWGTLNDNNNLKNTAKLAPCKFETEIHANSDQKANKK